ncbi:MAG: glycosyltransferase [Chthoniobacterales bacterium]
MVGGSNPSRHSIQSNESKLFFYHPAQIAHSLPHFRSSLMNVRRDPIIVLLGLMTMMPVGGVIWQTIHYLIGLQRLGFQVYYAEDHGIAPSMFTDAVDHDGAEKAAAFIARTLQPFDLGQRWSYHAWHGSDRYFGIGESAIKRALVNASAVINLHGGTIPRPEHLAGGAFIYLETDPVAPEIELHNNLEATANFLAQHTAHFTFGENLGAPDCRVPIPPAPLQFYPTRQPVVLDLWQSARPPGKLFTTIANWRQPERQLEFEGEIYHWSKHHEFLKFVDLPRRTSQGFELALSSYEEADREMLVERGWKVRRALEFSGDADAYRKFIIGSRGEWTVAKDQNVRLKSGWFSDRAASYLAAGRPVITQETGFSNFLPTGDGLFAFTTMDEILAALEQVNADFSRHSQAACEIAREFFDAGKVLAKLLQEAGVSLRASVTPKRFAD